MIGFTGKAVMGLLSGCPDTTSDRKPKLNILPLAAQPTLSITLCLYLGLLLILPGCKQADDPVNWDASRVSEKIAGMFQLEEVQLTPNDGGFSGTAVDKNGEKFEVVVNRSNEKHELVFAIKGNRGTVLDGNVGLD
jgi:hypothetical protein